MTISVSRSRRVNCEASLALPMSARQVWGQLRDFHRYASHDHFHAGIAVEGGVPRAGAALAIAHRYGPFRVRRVGRILRWREGDGFAFSDLSTRGPRAGFPHVLAIRVSDAPTGCVVNIRVTGRWTAPTPRWMAPVWLWWVMVSITQRTRNDLLAFSVARAACP
jgi:hypothetical protein